MYTVYLSHHVDIIIVQSKVFYFEKYFENTILFCIFKILLSEYFILYFQNTL